MPRHIRNCIAFYNFWNVSNNNLMLPISIAMKKFNHSKKKDTYMFSLSEMIECYMGGRSQTCGND